MNENWIHLCIDMQRVFAEDTPWHVPWMREVSPQIEEVASRYAERTVFTRFITPEKPEQMSGMWRAYYEKWRTMTRAQLDPGLLDIVPTLTHLIPPARIFAR
jgi:nicotinamidase-related amidase